MCAGKPKAKQTNLSINYLYEINLNKAEIAYRHVHVDELGPHIVVVLAVRAGRLATVFRRRAATVKVENLNIKGRVNRFFAYIVDPLKVKISPLSIPFEQGRAEDFLSGAVTRASKNYPSAQGKFLSALPFFLLLVRR